MSHYITTKEAAKLLGISPITVTWRVRKGRLTPINPNTKSSYLFKRNYIKKIALAEEELHHA